MVEIFRCLRDDAKCIFVQILVFFAQSTKTEYFLKFGLEFPDLSEVFDVYSTEVKILHEVAIVDLVFFVLV